MQEVIEIILLLVGFYFIMLFHEGGHFIASKIVKFNCNEFQIGVGPNLFSKEHNGTKFSLKAIPFGGICTFKEFAEGRAKGENVRKFYLRKIAVLLAGPFMNFVLAFALMIFAFGNTEGLMVQTVNDIQLKDTVITQGNIIRNINDERVFNANDIEDLLVLNMENTITFLNSEYEKETVSFYCNDTTLDIVFDESFGNKINGSVRTFGKYIELMTESVGELFSGESSIASETVEVLNPYEAMNGDLEVPQSFSRNLNKFIMITSIISFCLGALNLLPVIIFDGFKAMVSLISVIIGRDIPKKANIVIGVIGIIISILIIF